MSKLILLVGPIASGKSTFAKNMCACVKHEVLIVNDDAIVECVHGGDYGQYTKELKPLYKMIENTIVQMGLAAGKTVIIDRPNHSALSRKRFIGLAKSLDAHVQAVIFPRETPEIQASKRFASGNRGKSLAHWIKAAKRHEEDYDIVCFGEGINEITSC